MRRSAHRSRPKATPPGQSRLDFGDAEDAARVATVLPIAGRLAARARAAAAVERTAAEWFDLGCELEASSPEQARSAYRRAVEADDGHADAHLNLGRLLHEAGDLRGAEGCYRRALEQAPEEATAAFNLGVVLEDQRRGDEAIASYELAVAADPDFHDAYHNLVRLHEQRGDKAAAVRVLKRLRERTR
jgi:tetratricopeptide (TPR) repeat protein